MTDKDDDFNIEIIVEDSSDISELIPTKEKEIPNIEKTWIGLPIIKDGKKIGEETREIGLCSGKEMLTWATSLYPLVGNLGYKASDFETRRQKEELFSLVIQGLKNMGVLIKIK